MARKKEFIALRRLLLVAVFLLAGVGGGGRTAVASPRVAVDETSTGHAPPRLVVVLVIDQFRADYLERFRPRFGPDGFNRLRREGANFVSCFYPYARTVTAAGHATLATGTTPNRHGITANEWYNFERGRKVPAVRDESSPIVGSSASLPGVSPRNLVGTTFADQLRLATGDKAKVFGVALKDRATVFSLGRRTSGAYWYDQKTGRFITSRYYREQLPDWVTAFNEQHGADRYYGKDWKVGDRVFLSLSTRWARPSASFYGRLRRTPYGNEIVAAFAREMLEQEELGADETTDFLFIGFSSNDLVGHRWGPYSDQVAEISVQTDLQVAELLAFLDRRVGEGEYWLAVSADHGVAPLPAQARAHGLPAKSFDPSLVWQAVEEALDGRWGKDDWLLPVSDLIFDRDTLRKHGVEVAEAAHFAGDAALGVDGVLGYVCGKETSLDPALTTAVRLSTFRWRSPDVYIVREPLALRAGDASHGSPHPYDQHVPLILFGPAFRAGVYPERVSTTDLAPTLATALGINPPALATGKILKQALRRPGARIETDGRN